MVAGTFAACLCLPLTVSDKGPSSKLVLAALGNNVAAEVGVFADIVAAAELGDRHVVVERMVCDLDVAAEGGDIEAVVVMELDLVSVVLVLDDIRSGPRSVCYHSAVDSHLE